MLLIIALTSIFCKLNDGPAVYEGENEFKEGVQPIVENGLEPNTKEDKGQKEEDLLHNNL